MSDYFITDRCTGCGACISRCEKSCIDDSSKPFIIIKKDCNNCGKCFDNCPLMAVKKTDSHLH